MTNQQCTTPILDMTVRVALDTTCLTLERGRPNTRSLLRNQNLWYQFFAYLPSNLFCLSSPQSCHFCSDISEWRHHCCMATNTLHLFSSKCSYLYTPVCEYLSNMNNKIVQTYGKTVMNNIEITHCISTSTIELKVNSHVISYAWKAFQQYRHWRKRK